MKAKAFIQVLRTNDWWNNIIPPILGFFALGQLSLAPDFRILYMFGNVFLLMIFTAIFGFFIGEWSDIKDDTKAGKKNLLVGKSSSFKFGFTILSVIGICFFSFQLRLSNFDLYLLVIAQMLCFILYSIPPFRLKKNKLASLVLDSLYSGTLMYVFVFAIGRQDATGSLVVLFIWGFLRGQRNYILHTLNDAKNDQQIGIKKHWKLI
ncbi:MAG: hypothetical protein R2753_13145 [Chitinophagales bacterium]